MNPRDPRRGVVLALVLILALVLSATTYSFGRRAIVDALVAKNRDAAAEAEALARGGVELALALVLQDLLEEQDRGPGETSTDPWARARELDIRSEEGGQLRLRIEDAGSRLNPNALVDFASTGSAHDPDAEEFLVDFFEKVIDEIPLPPGEKLYDPRDLAQNLLDYLDPDDVRIRGGREDDFYRRQDPPYTAANRPLLSVEEIGRVEGFDAPLVTALRPYLSVYPLVGAQGINLNTAPPHVLAAVYHGTGGNRRLANEDVVREILRARQRGRLICDQTETDSDRCISLAGVRVEGSIYPAAAQPASASVFRVVSEARVGQVVRSVEAVIDRGVPAQPRLLFWRVR